VSGAANLRLGADAVAWMDAPATRRVMAALAAEGGAARFVGGAVRNALLGEPVGDVDIATPLVPDAVILLLQRAGLRAVPTGLAHGTVTAIAEGKGFEITTLRRDVETDGRHAQIAFTADWAADAERRDFTMNALYADADGTVHDFTGGVADLSAGRVRFVGEPAARIREDYLRILRLFRFHAWYGKGALDEPALAAAAAEKSGIRLLSGERVRKEMLRLLEARDPAPTLAAMKDAGILDEILPGAEGVARLARLVGLEVANGLAPDALLRLAALLPDSPGDAAKRAAALKMSGAERARLVDALAADSRVKAGLAPAAARTLLYHLGAPAFRDQLLLHWAEDAEPCDGWRAVFDLAKAWKRPRFPLDGRDAMAAGIAEGPELGAVLRGLEEAWMDSDFTLGREDLLARLKRKAERPGL
jgi:poly(A) polymerase